MKLTSYSPSVGTGNVNAKVANAPNIASYAADTSGVAAVNKGLAAASGVVLKAIEDREAVNVTAASLEYSKRMSDYLNNKDNGIMLTQQKASEGITQAFQTKEAEIRQKVMEEYGIGGYKKSLAAFNNMADKDALIKYDNVNKHEYTQMEKYNDTVLGEKVQLESTNAAQNWGDDNALQLSLSNIAQAVAVRYSKQGEAAVQAETRKAWSAALNGAIAMAQETGDTNKAEALMDRYGAMVSLQQRLKTGALIYKQNEENAAIQGNTNLYSQYGSNLEGALSAIDKAGKTGVSYDVLKANMDATKGQPYKLGTDGSDGTWDCGLWTKTMLGKVGVQLNNRCADWQYIQMEKEGKAFTDASKARPGDLVFWHTTDRWQSTDSQTPTDAQAYKGITHVGIYVGDGKAMQAGGSGVGLMSIEGAVGFGRTSGNSLSPAQLEHKKQSYQQYYRQKQAVERTVESNAINDGTIAIEDIMRAGGSLDAVMGAVNKFSAGNSNVQHALIKQYDKYKNYLDRQSEVAATGSGGNGAYEITRSGNVRLSNGVIGELQNAVYDDNLSSSDLRDMMQGAGLPEATIQKYVSQKEKAIKDSIDWDAAKYVAKTTYGIEDADFNLAKALTSEWVRQERAKGNEPSNKEIAEYISNTALQTNGELFREQSGFFGMASVKEGPTRAAAYNVAGIYRYDKRPDGLWDVYYRGMGKPKIMTQEQLLLELPE